MTANTLYSNFIDRDTTNTLKNNKKYLDYIAHWAGGIIRYDLYNELKDGFLYLMLGSTYDTIKLNFMSTNFTIIDGNAFTTASLGYSENGLSFAGTFNLGRTGFNPTALGFTKQSYHMMCYHNGTDTSFAYELGTFSTGNFTSLGVNRGGSMLGFIGGKYIVTSNVIKGSLLINSNLSTNMTLTSNGRIVAISSEDKGNGTIPDAGELVLGQAGNISAPSYESSKTIQLASAGLGFTDTKGELFTTLARTSQGILNRQ